MEQLIVCGPGEDGRGEELVQSDRLLKRCKIGAAIGAGREVFFDRAAAGRVDILVELLADESVHVFAGFHAC
jgi:hypothetical protein